MFAVLAGRCFSFRILRTVFPSLTSFRGSTLFVFLSERQPTAADILPVLISLSNCLASSFTSDFFCFGCIIWRAFASVKSSSNRSCFHKIRRLSVLEFDPFVCDLVLGSCRCGRIIAAFIATLEFGISSTNDNSCWFSNSMNWNPGLFLLRTMKRGFQLTTFLYMIFVLISSSWSISFQGSKGAVVIAGGRWIRLCCVGQCVCFRCFR